MKPKNVILFFLPLFGCAEDTSMQMADWVLTNGQIYTVDVNQPWAEAVSYTHLTLPTNREV